MFFNSSTDYLGHLLSSIQVEKITRISLVFALSGDPKLIVKGGNYTYEGKLIEYFPVVMLLRGS